MFEHIVIAQTAIGAMQLWVLSFWQICCKGRASFCSFNYVNEFILKLCAIRVTSCTFQIHYINFNLLYLFSSSQICLVGWWWRERLRMFAFVLKHFSTFLLSSDGLFVLIFPELVYILEPQQSFVQNVFWADKGSRKHWNGSLLDLKMFCTYAVNVNMLSQHSMIKARI